MDETQERSRRPRLIEVAREAGVSIQTASHVLTGAAAVRVAKDTRKRVLAAAQKVGYRPNRIAQSMRSGKTNAIAVWIPIERPLPTYAHMLAELYRKAHDSGFVLNIVGIGRDLAYRGEGELPYMWPVDGVIAIDSGKAVAQFRADVHNRTVPVGVLAFEEFENADSVAWDIYSAARAVTLRMLEVGRRRIVHITPDWVIEGYPREQRKRGYTEALAEYGLTPEIIGVKSESSDASQRAMEEYLRANAAPDGVFAFHDNLAIGALRALTEAGVRIPDDCCVWGFSNVPEAADLRIPLSSVRVPIEGLIDQAWGWLINRIGAPEQPTRVAVLPMELIERASTLRHIKS